MASTLNLSWIVFGASKIQMLTLLEKFNFIRF